MGWSTHYCEDIKMVVYSCFVREKYCVHCVRQKTFFFNVILFFLVCVVSFVMKLIWSFCVCFYWIVTMEEEEELVRI